MKSKFLTLCCLFISASLWSQTPAHRLELRPYKPGFFDKDVMTGIEKFQEVQVPKKVKPALKIDVSSFGWVPKSVGEFNTWWKSDPISQGNTGTCWSFSTTSFFETEVYRLTKQTIKISPMYTAYWEYVEKARGFVVSRGASNFDEGSEGNAVVRIYRKYGAVPLESYTGMLPGQTHHNHETMAAEMRAYLASVKANNAWDEQGVLSTIRSILDHYMSAPPAAVVVNGKSLSPQQYLDQVLKLRMDDYVDVTSIMAKPYWTRVEYEVPDNWWHDSSYYNVPLNEYMDLVKKSIRKGYTLMIGGDVSETGFDAWSQIAVVPSYDIPSAYIDENARMMRFANGSTTDDHGMHLVGYLEKDGKDWYLVKDSGAGSRNCGKESENFGFYFMHEDYVKLKMMGVLVHKDMAAELLKRFKG
ncbi:MAG: C1 family peptidase [Sphingobacteriales bacterium]|nr:C1 family peptidase [Sphingobacteriales bacterium]